MTNQELKKELFTFDLDENYCTQPDLSIQKPFNLNEMIEIATKLKITEPKKPSLFNMPISINPLIPKNEMWFVDCEGTISMIVKISNSKLYRFILWWQTIVERIRNWIKKLTKN